MSCAPKVAWQSPPRGAKLGPHLQDHGQEVHRETAQVHLAPRVELLLELLAGFLVGCFPEYPLGGRAFKAQDSEDILKSRGTGSGDSYPWCEDTFCHQYTNTTFRWETENSNSACE